jgi:endonuclease/exonuclease/phosphatase family metal-dependent hydrolase
MLPVLDLFREPDGRAEAITKALSVCDYDIIIFQEAFTWQSRTVLKEALHDRYPFAYGPANRSWFSMKANSGIWILSKIPLRIRKEIEFTVSAGFDSYARKGAVLFEGLADDCPFQLIATHLQDDEYPQTIRNQQLKEIYSELIAPFSSSDTPQIICGDFNTEKKTTTNYHEMLDNLTAEDGELSGNIKVSFGDEENDAFKTLPCKPRLIDYVLTRNPSMIRWISRKIAILKSKWGHGTEYLSDHNGIEAIITFKKMDYLSKVYK